MPGPGAVMLCSWVCAPLLALPAESGGGGGEGVSAAPSSPPPPPSAVTNRPRHSRHHSDNTELTGLGEIDAHFPRHRFAFLQRTLRFHPIARLIISWWDPVMRSRLIVSALTNRKHREAQWKGKSLLHNHPSHAGLYPETGSRSSCCVQPGFPPGHPRAWGGLPAGRCGRPHCAPSGQCCLHSLASSALLPPGLKMASAVSVLTRSIGRWSSGL